MVGVPTQCHGVASKRGTEENSATSHPSRRKTAPRTDGAHAILGLAGSKAHGSGVFFWPRKKLGNELAPTLYRRDREREAKRMPHYDIFLNKEYSLASSDQS